MVVAFPVSDNARHMKGFRSKNRSTGLPEQIAPPVLPHDHMARLTYCRTGKG
jgi:hypothetical protein